LSVTSDGKWLIYDSNKSGNQDIYIPTIGTSVVAWDPASPKLYFRRFGSPDVLGEFWEASLNGAAPRLVLKRDTAKFISRRGEFATDGKRFYFTVASDEANVWLMELKR
jgi:hypothetical protein